MTRVRGTVWVACIAILASGCSSPASRDADFDSIDRALAYLLAHQNTDGGFPPEPGRPSDFSTSAWAAIAFGAAPVASDPRDRLASYLFGQASAVENGTTNSLSRVNPLSLYALAGFALGRSGGQWTTHGEAGRLEEYASNTSLLHNEELFLYGALVRMGHPSAAVVGSRIEAALNASGWRPHQDNPWFLGLALLAFIADGGSHNASGIARAFTTLRDLQLPDGGYEGGPSFGSDTSTTSTVLAVLRVGPQEYEDTAKGAADFLRSRMKSDGHLEFSEGSEFQTVKTTAEAILGWAATGPFSV